MVTLSEVRDLHLRVGTVAFFLWHLSGKKWQQQHRFSFTKISPGCRIFIQTFRLSHILWRSFRYFWGVMNSALAKCHYVTLRVTDAYSGLTNALLLAGWARIWLCLQRASEEASARLHTSVNKLLRVDLGLLMCNLRVYGFHSCFFTPVRVLAVNLMRTVFQCFSYLATRNRWIAIILWNVSGLWIGSSVCNYL